MQLSMEPLSPIEEEPACFALPLIGSTDLVMAFVTDVLEPIFEAFRAIAADRTIVFAVEELDELSRCLHLSIGTARSCHKHSG